MITEKSAWRAQAASMHKNARRPSIEAVTRVSRRTLRASRAAAYEIRFRYLRDAGGSFPRGLLFTRLLMEERNKTDHDCNLSFFLIVLRSGESYLPISEASFTRGTASFFPPTAHATVYANRQETIKVMGHRSAFGFLAVLRSSDAYLR